MSEALLRAEGVSRVYDSGGRPLRVLDELDLAIGEGDAVAVVGDSGVGKSTLLHILGGLDRPDAGRLVFRGADLLDGVGQTAWSLRQRLARYRNDSVGFVFQMHNLLPEFSAQENVEMPLRIGARAGDWRAAAADLLERLGLADRAHHVPAELSGGEQQRVAMARALVASPDLVLADEPTGNLDPSTGRRVFELLRELQRERGFALVLATHSERLARGCDRVLRLVEGRLRPLDEAETRRYFDGLGA